MILISIYNSVFFGKRIYQNNFEIESEGKPLLYPLPSDTEVCFMLIRWCVYVGA